MPRSVAPLILQDADEAQIQQWLSAFGTPQQVALRSRIVLASAAGESDSAIAERLDTNRKTVTLWGTRFAQEGLESFEAQSMASKYRLRAAFREPVQVTFRGAH